MRSRTNIAAGRRAGRRALATFLVGLALGALPARATPAPPWPDDALGRLAALALVQTLNADLLAHASATLTLDRWCAAHRLAEKPLIVADRVRGQDKPAGEAIRALLKVSAEEPVRYRRVRLTCGDKVLSEADNWYLPGLLTPAMNETLETTDTSFGRVVKPLDFRRTTLAARLLWRPLPEGWEMGAALPPAGPGPLDLPPFLLEHRAVLTLPDGTPFSALVESYTREILAFPPPVGPPGTAE
ncbi:hypothetical protein KHC23_00575 [Ancylobacter dichloromethanicus]|uniref:Chorismate lyase n=1 Tax=Ancylobacter dichloromethanicus TaxID=518825 RepID=A0A9W6N164_9HYPH|nr:hypothetical protein [Ancylobacter dichloromethanicus]MBS7552152.1 hypothetical protein [Ancylobacter dichloromethanicus]GLK73886.1 hypothetical protein GCM10017643_40040 [Ancylobacter dichloromethanicus]